jgi:hypothetical protein
MAPKRSASAPDCTARDVASRSRSKPATSRALSHSTASGVLRGSGMDRRFISWVIIIMDGRTVFLPREKTMITMRLLCTIYFLPFSGCFETLLYPGGPHSSHFLVSIFAFDPIARFYALFIFFTIPFRRWVNATGFCDCICLLAFFFWETPRLGLLYHDLIPGVCTRDVYRHWADFIDADSDSDFIFIFGR